MSCAGGTFFVINGVEYMLGPSRLSGGAPAVAACAALGMQLATVNSKTLHTDIQQAIWSLVGNTSYWIGASRTGPGPNDFMWLDGTPYTPSTMSFWADGNPDNNGDSAFGNTTESCLMVFSNNGLLYDMQCNGWRINQPLCASQRACPIH